LLRHHKPRIYAGLLCLAISMGPATAQAPMQDVSAGELAAEFRQMQADLDASPPLLPAQLPDGWTVTTSEGHYSIPAQRLRSLVDAGRTAVARQWLSRMAGQLESYSQAPDESASNGRQRLATILARREFAGVHPPNAWDLFRGRIAAWISSLLQRLFAAASQHSGAAQVLFWILVAAVVGFIAMLLLRLGRSGGPVLALPRGVPGMGARHWETWLRDAHQAAAGGQWEEAIHCAYWAAIARLQEGRALPEDGTRTPREYLHLIRSDQSPAGPLRALTFKLERFWYARQTAAASDFDESLKHLESLGCRVD
jgi:hypothetical protein